MAHSIRLWLGIGASILLQAADAAAQPQTPPAGTVPDATAGGEGGEGGEGGIDLDRAADDPAVFLTALDVVAAHVLAARDAHAAGAHQAAAEMFAHPIAEILVPLEGVFAARGVPAFQDRLERAVGLALDGASPDAVGAAANAVLAALDEAALRAPGDGPGLAARARVLGGMLDRAALQYAAAAREPDALEPYLDGYGFLQAARRRASGVLPALEAAGRGAAVAAVRTAFALLDQAYPGALRPAVPPPTEPGVLLAAAGRARLALDLD